MNYNKSLKRQTKPMSKSDDDFNFLGCIGVMFIAICCTIHAIVFNPYIISSVYNWYLARFIGRGPMSWHVALGFSYFASMFLLGVARYKKLDEETEWANKCGYMVIATLSVWITYGIAYLFRNVNLFQ